MAVSKKEKKEAQEIYNKIYDVVNAYDSDLAIISSMTRMIVDFSLRCDDPEGEIDNVCSAMKESVKVLKGGRY